jgi:hypothetical protein
MKKEKAEKESLTLKIKRIRKHIASGVKTGASGAGSVCASLTASATTKTFSSV